MPALKIPPSDQKTLAKLLAFSPARLASLKEALRNAPPALLPSDLAKKMPADIFEAEEDAEAIITLLTTLYAVRRRADASVSEFVNEICEVAKTELLHDGGDWARIRDDLVDLLSLDATLGVTAKALDVMTEHQRILVKARILTDLRPVFKDNVNEPPAAAVIVHTLQLVFHENDEHKEFFVAMDSSDLESLDRLIERAKQKGSSLKALAATSKLTVLTP
jgi:hypothetical protein